MYLINRAHLQSRHEPAAVGAMGVVGAVGAVGAVGVVTREDEE